MSKPSPVNLDTPEGRSRFPRAHKAGFFALAQSFEPQRNRFCCGVACSVVVLNALRDDQERVYAQPTLLNARTDRVKPRRYFTPWARGKTRAGVTLDELGQILNCFPVSARTVRPKDAGTFRRTLQRVTKAGKSHLIVNFSYEVLFGAGGGHFSPVGAFDPASDSALILDVANYRKPWYWAPVDRLFAAMAASDADSRRSRGYLEITTR
jgi:hypothetical protein